VSAQETTQSKRRATRMQQAALQKGMLALVGIHASWQPLFWRYDHLLGQMHSAVD